MRRIVSIILITIIMFTLSTSVSAENVPEISVSSASAKQNETVKLDVSINNNPGIASYILKLNFDNTKLLPVSISGDGIISNIQQPNADLAAMTYVTAVWGHTQDSTANGILFSVEFKVISSTAEDTPVTLSYKQGNICNQNLEDVIPNLVHGKVTITKKSSSPSSGGGGGGTSSITSTQSAATSVPTIAPTAVPEIVSTETPEQAENSAKEIILPFKDVKETDWFYDVVKEIYARKLMSGTETDTFAPDMYLTRGMMAAVLGRLENVTDISGNANYSDVDGSLYYAPYVVWGTENGIFNGFEDGTFRPNDTLTREQMAKVIACYYEYKGYETGTAELAYNDIDLISEWALNGVKHCTSKEIMTGRPDNTFDPSSNITRAEFAAVMIRIK